MAGILVEPYRFLREIFVRRSLIVELVKRDFFTQYIDSVFGLFWAFVQPFVMVFILWFIFSFGFKAQPVKDVPFVVWLTAGLAPWFFFLSSVGSNVSIIVQNSYMVKKIIFKVSILPIVKMLSSSIIHLVFLILLVGLMFLSKVHFSLWWFQIIYYLFAFSILILGLSWLTSSLFVFIKDIGQLVNIVLQFGFWATPIFWNIDIIPQKYQILIKLNPVFYIVDGYRGSLIYHIPFWLNWKLGLYYWGLTILILLVGVTVFKKLRPHFADVL